MSPNAGALTLVLHTHLPWVLHHGRWPHGMDWLSEAVAESYLPLLAVLEPRARPEQPLGLTIGLTPVLCEQLSHADFVGEFRAYLAQKSHAAREDDRRFQGHGAAREAALARGWIRFYDARLRDFESGPDLVARFLGRPFGFESYREWLNEAN